MTHRRHCPHCGRSRNIPWKENARLTWIEFLRRLVEAGRPVTVREASEITGTTRGNAWNRLDRLRQAGMVRRDERDHVYWAVTEQGIKTVTQGN